MRFPAQFWQLVFDPAMAVDRWLADLLDVRGLPLMSAGILLVICCAMRFQAIAIGALDSGLGRIPLAGTGVSSVG